MTPFTIDRADIGALRVAFERTRARTMRLCRPLSAEDMVVQFATETSPVKWHLAHTTWFFETFMLEAFEPDFRPHHHAFRVLFNSYYRGVGAQHPRGDRGVLTRPPLDEVFEYRAAVDERIVRLLENLDDAARQSVARLLILGVNHEQQHQELIVTDVKRLLFANPLAPSYHAGRSVFDDAPDPGSMRWLAIDEGVATIGHGGDGFHFDNETPRHRRFVEPYAVADRTVTNGEYRAFIEDGGYERHELWLDEGWTAVASQQWTAPLYWRRDDVGAWSEFTMRGMQPLDPHRPVTHISFYEADAYARWAGARLPTEVEWEHAATTLGCGRGALLESGRLHPNPALPGLDGLRGMLGDVWEWTRSAHEPYPGYCPPEGAVGEYNGKFMCNQYVLRGGSCATPGPHLRLTYRNFFHADARWQFAGVRLARSDKEPR